MKDTVWAYAAVSSSPQEATLESQVAWCKDVARANGWEITKTWSAVGSGKDGTRKLLDDLLTALHALPRAQRPARILMVRLDRLGRGSGLESVAALADLKRLGVGIWTREDGPVKLERASDSILPSIRAIVAGLENEARSDRVRAGQERRRAAGKHLGMVPFGVVLVDGKPVRFEAEGLIVDEVFELLAAGWGLERVAGHIRGKAPPKRLGNGAERALTWGPSTIRSIYESQVVRTVVVSESLLARAEAARRQNYRYRPTGEWEWPLRGAVHCACGHLLVGHATGTAPHRTRYYRCRSHPFADRGEGNRRPGHRADKIEKSFVSILKKLAAHPEQMLRGAQKAPVEKLKAQEAHLRQQLTRADRRRRRACELAEDGAYSGKELRDRLDRIDGERRALSAQIEEVAAEIHAAAAVVADGARLAEVARRLPELWPVMPIEERQKVAKAIAQHLGGLYADPTEPGVLRPRNVASLQKSSVIRMIATCFTG